MKVLKVVIFLLLVAAAGTWCFYSARAAIDPARLQRENGLRLHLELQKELLATGQTNLAAKLDEMVMSMLLQESTHDVRTHLGVLRRLRAQGTNAIDSIEADLDLAIVSLADFDELGKDQLGPDQIKALQVVRDYRSKYPRKTESPKTDTEVDRLLERAVKK